MMVLLASAQEASQYTGPGSCSSPSCHGAVQPRSTTSVQQNEYSTWVIKDKHAQAFTVLSNSVSMRIELGDALRERGVRVRVAENGLIALKDAA